jgi:hypothetical protein
MSTPPAGIPETDWLATAASVRTLIIDQRQVMLALRQEDDEHRGQLTALATDLASLWTQMRRPGGPSRIVAEADADRADRCGGGTPPRCLPALRLVA